MTGATRPSSMRWPALLVLLLGLSAAYFTRYYAARDEAEEASAAFRRLGGEHAARLEDFLHGRVAVLRVLAAALSRDPALDADLLRAMVDEAVASAGDREPIFRHVGWAPRILDSGLPDFVAARRPAVPDYRVQRPDGGEARDGYAHVVLDSVWPPGEQARLGGLDLAAEPGRQQTLDRALSAAEPEVTLSGQVDLLDPEPGGDQAGVFFCVPVYPPQAALRTEDQRQKTVLGFVVAEASMREVMEAAFARDAARFESGEMCITVWDENAVLVMLGRSPVLTAPASLHSIDVMGRSWRVETRPAAEREPTLSELLARPSTLLPLAVVLVASLSALIVWIIQRQSALVRREVTARTAELREKNEALERKEFELNDANRRLLEMSNTDALTGILNRRAFEVQYDNERERSTRSAQVFGLLLFDIDHFKGFNDLYGHVKGDDVLRRVAQVIRNEARRIDCVARYGGEEFVVLASGADANGLMSLGERIRARVQEAAIENQSAPLGVITVSGGGALSGAAKGRDPRELIEIADRCLYQAKTSGRNQVAMVM